MIIHSTLDTLDLNKDIAADYALIGDAKLTLGVLISAVKGLLKKSLKEEISSVAGEIAKVKAGVDG